MGGTRTSRPVGLTRFHRRKCSAGRDSRVLESTRTTREPATGRTDLSVVVLGRRVEWVGDSEGCG